MLTIIIPVYNEGENIKTAVENIEREVKYPYVINVIYDFDEDSTIEPAKKLNVNLVKNKYGRGSGRGGTAVFGF
mgnify:CR=1 FL=1